MFTKYLLSETLKLIFLNLNPSINSIYNTLKVKLGKFLLVKNFGKFKMLSQ